MINAFVLNYVKQICTSQKLKEGVKQVEKNLANLNNFKMLWRHKYGLCGQRSNQCTTLEVFLIFHTNLNISSYGRVDANVISMTRVFMNSMTYSEKITQIAIYQHSLKMLISIERMLFSCSIKLQSEMFVL